MTTNSEQERRQAERVQTDLKARWEGVLAASRGSVVDISVTGCFVLTNDDVQTGELIRLEITTPTGRDIYLWGEVVYQISEMGFALRFTGGDDVEQKMLLACLEYLRESRAEAVPAR